MFGRKKQDEAVPEADVQDVRPGAKNRPTPKRREAQAARLQPLVPADRKAAAQSAKERERSERARRQAAMRAGEQWALLPRDRGPERAWIRDVVDSRWNVGEFILPVVLVSMVLTMMGSLGSTLYLAGMATAYGAVAVFFLDMIVLWFQMKRRYADKFGGKPGKGLFFYAMSRSLSMRRTRMPSPRVNRGDRVD